MCAGSSGIPTAVEPLQHRFQDLQGVGAHVEPLDPGIPPEPPLLAAGKAPGCRHGIGDGVGQGALATEVRQQLAVAEGLCRRAGRSTVKGCQPADLVEEAILELVPVAI